MDVVQITAPQYPEQLIVTEWDPLYSREAGSMAVGLAAAQFAVLGQLLLGAPTVAPKYEGNTGNGALSLDGAAPLQPGAQPGNYAVRFRDANDFDVYDPGGELVASGSIGGGAASVAAKNGMVGNGALTLDPETPVLGGAAAGGYKVIFTGPLAFNVTSPSNAAVGAGVVGQEFANQVQFTVAAGATAFAANDEFDITVSSLQSATFNDEVKFTVSPGSIPFVAFDEFDIEVPGGGEGYAPLAPAANDGTQTVAGVAIYKSDSDGEVTVLARGPVVVRREELVWPVGITGPQMVAALRQLTALGIISRATG